MENNNIYETLKEFEIFIDNSFKFLEFIIINPQQFIKYIDKVEKSLPIEILKAKHQLIKENKSESFKHIENLKMVVNRSFILIPNVLHTIKSEDVLIIIDKLYACLPADIQEARAILNS